jgi:hypothetical protein
MDRQQDRGRNVYFYTTLALVLVLVGCNLVLPGRPLNLAFAGLAVLACVGWSRLGRLFLTLHGAAYVLAAGLVSGSLAYAATAFVGGAAGPWIRPSTASLIVLGAALVCAWFAAKAPIGDGNPKAALPRFVIILVTVSAAGGVVVGYLAPMAAGLPDGAVDAGVLATLRTAVLALAAIAVAWIGRQKGFSEWAWLVYPILVVTGVKMVAQDFMHSRPATMFVALALYGIALSLAPRLRRPQA